MSCYPKVTSVDLTSGKEVTETMNRYFVMFNDQALDEARKKKASEERKWRKWVDDVLVHTLR